MNTCTSMSLRAQSGPLPLSANSFKRRWRWKSKTSALTLFLLFLSALWMLVVAFKHCHSFRADPEDLFGEFFVATQNPNFSVLPNPWPVGSVSEGNLSVDKILFGIAGSAKLWPRRKEIVRLWWRRGQMRGFVWVEDNSMPHDSDETLPPVRVSEDITQLRYGSVTSHPAGLRLSRIVLEMFRLNLPDVHWFVLADDDTLFSVDNLVRVLSKYDPAQFHYIGGLSESHQQNVKFSYGMAFGGGGVAISYALASALAGMQDNCLEHYLELHGSDDRLYACVSELGVPLTRELGFHQCDIRGKPLGLLGSHPIAPFVSLHHVETMDPLFPGLGTHEGLRHLLKPMQMVPESFLQQSFCYSQKQGFSFSVSVGYVVQAFPEIIYPQNLGKIEVTFKAWNGKGDRQDFDLDTRFSRGICSQPHLFFFDDIEAHEGGFAVSNYTRYRDVDEQKKLWWCRKSLLETILTVRVRSQPLPKSWYHVPRRQCCFVTGMKDKILEMHVRPCQPGEVIVS